jgi:hypothetical protein
MSGSSKCLRQEDKFQTRTSASLLDLLLLRREPLHHPHNALIQAELATLRRPWARTDDHLTLPHRGQDRRLPDAALHHLWDHTAVPHDQVTSIQPNTIATTAAAHLVLAPAAVVAEAHRPLATLDSTKGEHTDEDTASMTD